MKYAHYIISILALIIAALYGYINIHREQVQKKQEEEADAFTMESVKSITAAWNADELKSRAHPMLLDFLNNSHLNLDDYFAVLKKLGHITQESQCTLDSFSINYLPKTYAAAEHTCTGQYENGPAAIHIAVRQDEPQKPWQITLFRIDSPLFKPPAEKVPAKAPEKPQEKRPEK